MEYPVFETRVMELLFKTNLKLTPQLVAFRVGCPVDTARKYLEQMATSEILIMDVDASGVIQYDVPGRPPATNEPLSWVNASSSPALPIAPGPVYQHGVAPVNIQIQNAPAPQVVVVGSEKSVGTAVALGLLFGPLGMLYATGLGALVMFFINLALIPATLGVGWVITAPICAIWAANAASEHNRRLRQPLVLPVAQAPALPAPPR